MKNLISQLTITICFMASLGLATAYATPAPAASHSKTIDITGCLQPGPSAREYLLHAADGSTWGVTETDMLMNDYVNKTVTITGDAAHLTTSERKAGGAQHYVKAMDLVVESESCQK